MHFWRYKNGVLSSGLLQERGFWVGCVISLWKKCCGKDGKKWLKVGAESQQVTYVATFQIFTVCCCMCTIALAHTAVAHFWKKPPTQLRHRELVPPCLCLPTSQSRVRILILCWKVPEGSSKGQEHHERIGLQTRMKSKDRVFTIWIC